MKKHRLQVLLRFVRFKLFRILSEWDEFRTEHPEDYVRFMNGNVRD